jgi:hypothetical protein
MKTRKILSLLVVLAMLTSIAVPAAFAADARFNLIVDDGEWDNATCFVFFADDDAVRESDGIAAVKAIMDFKYLVVRFDGVPTDLWGIVMHTKIGGWDQVGATRITDTNSWYVEVASFKAEHATDVYGNIAVTGNMPEILAAFAVNELPTTDDDDDDNGDNGDNGENGADEDVSFTAFLAANEQSWQFQVNTEDDSDDVLTITKDGEYTLTLDWGAAGGSAGWLGIKTSFASDAAKGTVTTPEDFPDFSLVVTEVKFDGVAAELIKDSALHSEDGILRVEIYNNWEKERNIIDQADADGFQKVEVTFTVTGFAEDDGEDGEDGNGEDGNGEKEVIEYDDVDTVRPVDLIDIEFVTEAGLFVGSGGKFMPFEIIKEAQFLAVLSRLAGEDLKALEADADKWYDPYVEWADEFGIVAADDVDPDADLARVKMALWFYTYIITADEAPDEIRDAPAFTDIDDLDDDEIEAIEALYMWGIIEGSNPGVTFGTASFERVRVANVVARYLRALDGDLGDIDGGDGEDGNGEDGNGEDGNGEDGGEDGDYIINLNFKNGDTVPTSAPADATGAWLERWIWNGDDFASVFPLVEDVGYRFVHTGGWGQGAGMSVKGIESGVTYGFEGKIILGGAVFQFMDEATDAPIAHTMDADGVFSGTFTATFEELAITFNHNAGNVTVIYEYFKLWIVD